MYIRRKVFSRFIDEYGDERLFSTTDYEYDDYGYDERMYAYIDDNGDVRSANGNLIATKGKFEDAEDMFKVKGEDGKIKEVRVPKKYKGGTASGSKDTAFENGKYVDIKDRRELSSSEQKALKNKVGKRTSDMKNWNKTKAYKDDKASYEDKLKDLKYNLKEKKELRDKLGRAKAMNKGLLIGIGAAGAGAAGYGIYRAVKAKKAKKEEEKN